MGANPPPDPAASRSPAPTVGTAAATAIPSPGASLPASPPPATALPTPPPAPLPLAAPARIPLDLVIGADPAGVFAHELTKTWCAPAAVQMTLAVLGLADTSAAVQRRLQERVGEWESYDDSHNGRWGPLAMARALAAYGAQGYVVRVHLTRGAALADAAGAIMRTGSPVILLAWRGAHAWVMTGFRSDADPLRFPDATIQGAYVLDPWYPWISSIWGRSDPPGTFQDDAEMVRNFLPWKRPEGRYPERDGRFVIVVPTLARGPAE